MRQKEGGAVFTLQVFVLQNLNCFVNTLLNFDSLLKISLGRVRKKHLKE